MVVGSGLAVPTLVLAITFGALARAEGWGVVAPVLASIVVFSGSAQFATLTVLSAGGGLFTVLGTAALLNARFLPMGVALASDLRGGPFRRALEGQITVDGSFVAAHVGGGRYDRMLLFGATAAQYPAWVLGTVVGVVASPSASLIHDLGLDVAFPGFFLLLLIDELRRGRLAVLSAATGAVLAGALLFVVPTGAALLGASFAALLGLRRSR